MTTATRTKDVTGLNTYFSIGTYYGKYFVEKGNAPSAEDLYEVSQKNQGDLVILTENEARHLLSQLVRHLGNPKYTESQIKALKQQLGFAVKNGYMGEEQADDMLYDLEKGFEWNSH